MSKSSNPESRRGFKMRILKLNDLRVYTYDSSWMRDEVVTRRKGSEMGVVYAEYNELVPKLEPGETFLYAIHNLQILERDDGKYQIIFPHDALPKSMQKWHLGDFVFKGFITDFMPLRAAFLPQIRELDNW